MSRMMQPRDQMSDLQVKENLRASGAIQDLWQGSVGKIKVEEPLSPMFPRDRETAEQTCLSTATPLLVLREDHLYPILVLNPRSSCLPVLRRQACSTTLSYTVPILVFLCKALHQEPFGHPPWAR